MPFETDLSEMISEMEKLSSRLETADRYLEHKCVFLRSFIACLPFPAWIKTPDLRMMYVNPAYEHQYGVCIEQYNEMFDHAVWNEATADEFFKNDNIAINEARIVDVVERVTLPDGRVLDIKLVKFPLITDGELIAVAGMALHSKEVSK